MILGRFRNHIAEHNWFAVSVDVVVVVVSILAAFQIERWAESRRNQDLELDYLLRLKKDLQMEMERMQSALEYANERITAVKTLRQVLDTESSSTEVSNSLPWAIETSTWRSFPQITAFVYTELQNTGNMSLISSESIRRGLAEHYQALQHDAEVGQDLTAQHQFEKSTAGLLKIDELVAVEYASWNGGTVAVSPERYSEIVVAFKQRIEAAELLPSLVQHHVYNKKVINAAIKRVRELIHQIDGMTSQSMKEI